MSCILPVTHCPAASPHNLSLCCVNLSVTPPLPLHSQRECATGPGRNWKMLKKCPHPCKKLIKVGAAPYISVSVHVSVFHTHVDYFKLHLKTTLCPLSDGFYLIGWEYLFIFYYFLFIVITKNDNIMIFLLCVSTMERVMSLPIHVWTRVDGCGHMGAERCSLPYAIQWFASIHGHG